MRIAFEEVAIKAVKRWTDEAGKARQKTKRFSQTVSPYNKNTDGTVKTREQITAEIKEARDKWMAGA